MVTARGTLWESDVAAASGQNQTVYFSGAEGSKGHAKRSTGRMRPK
jgi:hypothetical protein